MHAASGGVKGHHSHARGGEPGDEATPWDNIPKEVLYWHEVKPCGMRGFRVEDVKLPILGSSKTVIYNQFWNCYCYTHA